MRYESFLKAFYTFRFFTDFAFIYAVYVILFQIRGLSIFHISLLLAIWSGFVVFLEVPTGALADKWNRKHMLTLGLLSKAIGFGIWIFADSFWMFALGFLFWGVQEAFCSGTEESLLYDNLKKFKKLKFYHKILGTSHFYHKIAIAISVLIGGFLAAYSFNWVLILSSASMLVALIATLFLQEVKFKHHSTEEVKYWQLIRNAIKEAARNKVLLRIMFYGIFAVGVIAQLEEFDQLYFGWLGLPLFFFGVMAVIISGSEAIGAKIAYKFSNHFKNFNNLYFLALATGIILVFSVWMSSLYLIPLYVVAFFLMPIAGVYNDAALQKNIKTNERATITSIKNLLVNLTAILFTILAGALSKIGGLQYVIWTFAGILIVYSLIALIFKK